MSEYGENTVAGTHVTVFGYSYDGGSRLWVEQLNLPSGSEEVTLQHNPANQITLRSSTNNSYQFANVWNPTRGYTSDGLNRLTSSDGAALSYDGRGNLSVDQNGTSYGYDPLNNLVSTSNSIGLGYDPLGRLQVIGVNGVNTQFIYDGDQIIAELDGSFHPLRWYVDGPGEDQPMVWYEGWNTGDRRFLLADERGSIVSVTNGSGQVMATNTYDEYGLPGSGNLGRFQYTGQAWIPELGLYHYKARAYSPSLGRFMQTDPSGYGDGLNLYAYVHNDPVNEIDPTGLEGDPPTINCKPDGTDCESTEIVVTGHHPGFFSVMVWVNGGLLAVPRDIEIAYNRFLQYNNTGCAGKESLLSNLGEAADEFTDVSGKIATASTGLAVITSETGVGAAFFGGFAVVSKVFGFASTTVAVGAKLATGNFGGAVQSVGSYVFGSAISKALALGLEPNASEELKFETDAVGDITADNFPHSCGAGS